MTLLTIIYLLMSLESGMNPQAVGDGGRALGALQMHKIAVDEANRIGRFVGSPIRFTYEDRKDIKKCRQMSARILSFNIKRFRHRYGRKPSAREVMKAWRFTNIFKDPGPNYTRKIDRILGPEDTTPPSGEIRT